MLRLVVRFDREPARLELFGDDDGSLVEWEQEDPGHPELRRSHDGHLEPDGGHTGFESEFRRFSMDPEHDLGEQQRAVIARERVQLADAAHVGIRRRLALRSGSVEALLHESAVSPADGGEVLLWPPIAGPEGVLLRRWLMPGADTVWRDDYDEPLTILSADGPPSRCWSAGSRCRLPASFVTRHPTWSPDSCGSAPR